MKKNYLLLVFVLIINLVHAQSSFSVIKGKVRYDNADSTILATCKVVLSNETGTILDSTYTDASGSFRFQNLYNGTYKIKAYPTHPWGGVNSADALLVLKQFVRLINPSGLRLLSGDVDGSSISTAKDALMIEKRFTNSITSFPKGNFISETITHVISTPGTYIHNIKVLCLGDLNASFVPINTSLSCPGVPTFVYGGEIYNTILIGTQCWMKENLNIGKMVNGSMNQTNNDTIEKYCYLNDTANCNVYGGLYQWNEMMQYISNVGTQGICPSGWHIPSSSDWLKLENYLGGNSVAGGKIKETGTTHWFSPNIAATNTSGFTGLGSGRRYSGYHFDGLKDYLDFWASNSYNSSDAYNFYLYSYQGSTNQGTSPKSDGFSVRCIKDSIITNIMGMPCPGIPTVVYGGTTYHTIQIGIQCWFQENLNIGNLVYSWDNQTNNNVIEKYCYDNDTANCSIYGGLYQWSEMMQYDTTEGAQGICPSGWHIPSASDFSNLVSTLGGSSVGGGKLKEIGTNHWFAPNIGASNYSGFTGIGSGRRYSDYYFDGLMEYLDLWASSSFDGTNAYNLYLYGYEENSNQGYAPKSDGFSVRCIKDSTIPNIIGMPCPGIPTVVYGGTTYHTIQIGNHCWFQENLNIGNLVYSWDNQTNNNVIEKYCYNNDIANCSIYGGLYQWSEMMQYDTTEGAQGICPSGWHIPSASDFSDLVSTLGGSSVGGGKMKEVGTNHWFAPNIGASNYSGFTGIGSGRRYSDYYFDGLMEYLDLWASSSFDGTNAYNLYLYGYEENSNQGYAPKSDGFSVRCLKNIAK